MWFAVELMPQTLATTNLGLLRAGDRINIELDQIGKYQYKLFATKKGKTHTYYCRFNCIPLKSP